MGGGEADQRWVGTTFTADPPSLEGSIPELLVQLAMKANASEDHEDAIAFTLESICNHEGWAVGHATMLVDPVGGPDRPDDIWFPTDPTAYPALRAATREATFEAGAGVVGRAIADREPVWLSDLSSEPSFFRRDVARQEGLSSGLLVPVRAGRDVPAILEFFATDRRMPDPTSLRRADAAGLILGEVIQRRRSRAELERTGNRLRTVLETMPAPVAMTDAESGRYVFVNSAFCSFIGLTIDDVIGRTAVELGILPDESLRSRLVELQRKGPVTEELRVCTVDGSHHHVLFSGRSVRWDGTECLLGTFIDMTERRSAELLAMKRQDQIQVLLGRLLTAQEEERQRIARELHDQIGQSMTAVQLDLTALLNSDLDTDARRSVIFGTMSTIDSIMAQLRSLSFDLRPAMLEELGLASALSSFAARLTQHTEIDVQLKVADVDLPHDVRLTCFRIAQEALTNAVRHANSTQIRLELSETVDGLRMTVADDGSGFAQGAEGDNARLGIEIMKERARGVGATLDIGTAPGAGTTVELTIRNLGTVAATAETP